ILATFIKNPLHRYRIIPVAIPQSVTDLHLLIQDSGLLSPEAFTPFFTSDKDQITQVLNRLQQERLITGYQAQQLERGKFRGFFLTDKYKLLEFLGAGGMGSVFLCEHLILQRLVAVKILHLGNDPDSIDGQAVVARFYREARAVAALDHPNIVRVF